MTGVEFTVRGIPVPQGTARAFVAGGRAHIATEANKPGSSLGAWRVAIATEAAAAMGRDALLEGAVGVTVDFVMPRPLAHYGKSGIRLTSPKWHRSRPDADKLLRSLLDAITGVVIRDDSQVALVVARKPYEDEALRPGCVVRVVQLESTR